MSGVPCHRRLRRDVDLLIVGGGAIGLAAAWRAAERGLRVRLVECAVAGAGASHAAAGALAPTETHEWHGPLGAMNLGSMVTWPGFADELAAATGVDPGYRRDGALRVARTDDEHEQLALVRLAVAREGLEHEMLDASGCLREERGLRGVCAGLLTPGEAHVDTGLLLAALVSAARAAGAEVSEGVEPVSARLVGCLGLHGLELSDGSVQPAALTVLAAGAWSARMRWLPAELRPPVRPVAGEFLLLGRRQAAPVCRRVIRTARGLVAPRSGGTYWVGTSVRESGFEELPLASAVAGVLTGALDVLPALGDLAVERVGVGLRPLSADGLPIVGPAVVGGLAFATGHGREGIIYAPLTAEAIVALALGDSMPELLAPFAPCRLGL